jgi:hypothetical protein
MAPPTLADALAANHAFYNSFANQDFPAMEMLWAKESSVSSIHPGWPPMFDREAVLSSWHDIMTSETPPTASYRNDKAFIHGTTAVVVCEELVDGNVLAATNIFVDERGAWRLVHHQAGPIVPRKVAPVDSPPRAVVH